MDYYGLKIHTENRIAVITMHRPEALNAINSELINSLGRALKTLSMDKTIRALVITGSGKAFVAGADVKELAGMKSDAAYNFSMRGQQAFQRLEMADFPVIAAINGYALGGGLELALACDIRIAATTAKFGMPEVSLGLMPGFAGTQRLCRTIGYASAMQLMCSATPINTDEALRIGLIQQVTEPGELMSVCMQLAEQIASNGKYAVRGVKELARKSITGSFADACELESEVFASLFGYPESGEGMNAFIEKRKPEWKT